MPLIGESGYLLKMGARSLEMAIVSMTRKCEIGNNDVCARRSALDIRICNKISNVVQREKMYTFSDLLKDFQHILSRRSQFSRSHYDLESEKD
jgi:hypothetical protein